MLIDTIEQDKQILIKLKKHYNKCKKIQCNTCTEYIDTAYENQQALTVSDHNYMIKSRTIN